MTSSNKTSIRVGVSTCLLGEPVRHDGSHRRNAYILGVLANHFEFVPVCPETDCGLGVPRASMRLIGDPDAPDSWRLVAPKTGQDHTDRMLTWTREKLDELEASDLCGFIFKAKSPSSGMERVSVFPVGKPQPVKKGVGLFAREFMRRFPLIPVEEDGRLNDARLRENFIERVFVMKRWRDLLAGPPSIGTLVEFHTHHKMLVRAHNPQLYRALGSLVACAKQLGLDAAILEYQRQLMAALAYKTTPSKHADVLLHILGHFKKQLTHDEKLEFTEVVERYKKGYVPLIVPITLANHFTRKYGEPYLRNQHYLNPHPMELALRNHA